MRRWTQKLMHICDISAEARLGISEVSIQVSIIVEACLLDQKLLFHIFFRKLKPAKFKLTSKKGFFTESVLSSYISHLRQNN